MTELARWQPRFPELSSPGLSHVRLSFSRAAPTAPGPYAYIDMNGTRHNVTRTHPLLGPEQPHSLLLDGYYDVGWSGKHGKHSVKTITKRHANEGDERDRGATKGGLKRHRGAGRGEQKTLT